MLQDRSRQWIRVVFAVVALVALGLATVALLNATVAVSEAKDGDHSLPFAPRRPTRTFFIGTQSTSTPDRSRCFRLGPGSKPTLT